MAAPAMPHAQDEEVEEAVELSSIARPLLLPQIATAPFDAGAAAAAVGRRGTLVEYEKAS